MRKFLFLCITSLAGAPIMYFALVTIALGRAPSLSEFYWPTENSSLNASLAHWTGTHSDNMIIGSSIALRNISANSLSAGGENWHTIGGFGLDPNQSLALIQELNITHAKIILPLSILEIDKINNRKKRDVQISKTRITTLKSFIHLEKLKRLDNTNYSHINFDTHGNCMIKPSSNGQNVPEGLIGKLFTGDTTGIIKFAQRCNSIGKILDSHIFLVTTPFCNELGELNEDHQKLICNIQYNASHCTLQQHLCDPTDPYHFTDAYHFNSIGAEKFTSKIKSTLTKSALNALQQP